MFLLRSHLSRLAASFYSKEREHPLPSVDGRDGCSSSYVLSRSTATGLGEEKAEVEETELRRTTESALLPSHEDIAAALTDSLKTLLRYAIRLHDPTFFPAAAPSFTSSPVNASSSASSSVSPTAPQLASDWRFSVVVVRLSLARLSRLLYSLRERGATRKPFQEGRQNADDKEGRNSTTIRQTRSRRLAFEECDGEEMATQTAKQTADVPTRAAENSAEGENRKEKNDSQRDEADALVQNGRCTEPRRDGSESLLYWTVITPKSPAGEAKERDRGNCVRHDGEDRALNGRSTRSLQNSFSSSFSETPTVLQTTSLPIETPSAAPFSPFSSANPICPSTSSSLAEPPPSSLSSSSLSSSLSLFFSLLFFSLLFFSLLFFSLLFFCVFASASPPSPSSSSSVSSSSSPCLSEENAARGCVVLAVLHEGRGNAQTKATNWVEEKERLLSFARAAEETTGEKIEEVLLMNTSQEILEGLSSNFFVYSASQNRLFAGDAARCLPGTVRALVLKLLEKEEIFISESAPCWRLREAEEWTAAFLTSTSRLVCPVRKILVWRERTPNKVQRKTPRPGPQRLADAAKENKKTYQASAEARTEADGEKEEQEKEEEQEEQDEECDKGRTEGGQVVATLEFDLQKERFSLKIAEMVREAADAASTVVAIADESSREGS
ncbi:aminotransferase class IV [Toxoplasma gondii VAND]|uniref:Aminotransferase class IV n=1 Tax=Toxoplasma gondii VAND TaxID=933077 RepID=A0A086PIL3_TOXGO|nr:aminotransferase class IV [Toxoplasma gondii VAND]